MQSPLQLKPPPAAQHLFGAKRLLHLSTPLCSSATSSHSTGRAVGWLAWPDQGLHAVCTVPGRCPPWHRDSNHSSQAAFGTTVPNPHNWHLAWQSLSWVNKDQWPSPKPLETVPGRGNFLVWKEQSAGRGHGRNTDTQGSPLQAARAGTANPLLLYN